MYFTTIKKKHDLQFETQIIVIVVDIYIQELHFT